MIDLKKTETSTELVKTELQELTATNQQFKDELDRVRYKLGNELDLLTYKLEKTQSDIQDIRRDIHEINMTIDKLRREVYDALRNNKSSDLRDIISSLFPFLIITLPCLFIAGVILIMALTS